MRNKNQTFLLSLVLFLVCALFVFHASFAITDGSVSFSWGQDAFAQGASSSTDPDVDTNDQKNNWFIRGINMMLEGIRAFLSLFVTAMAILLTYMIDAKTFTTLVNDDAVVNSWKVVRDFLNLGFIIVLLFSAFATVFQIEKYHIKKILLTLVIMALLVNFSYPISRFVIDTANVPMYYIAETVFGSDYTDAGAIISRETRIGDIIEPNRAFKTASPVEFIAAVVFTFIFAMTLASLAFMFLIRMVVLILMVIFSPIGFAAAIFPSTQNYANEYWNTLFKNAFFGPIMMLVLAISLYVLEAFQGSDALQTLAQNNGGSANITQKIAAWAYFCIPVVMLWGGIIWSQKLGAVGASFVISRAQKWSMPIAKGMFWAGTAGHGLGYGKRAYDYTKSIPLGLKKAWFDNPRDTQKQRLEDNTALWAGRAKLSGASASRSIRNKQIERELKEMEEKQIDPSAAKQLLKSKNDAKRIAAVRYLAKNKFIQTPEDLANAVEAAGGSTKALDEIVKNMSGTALDNMNDEQRRTLFDAIDSTESKIKFTGFDEGTVKAQAKDVRRTFEKEFREKGQIHQLIELDIQTEIQRREGQQGHALSDIDRNVVRNSYYNPEYRESKLKGRTLADLAKQDIALFREPAFQTYLARVKQTTPQNYQRFYADLSPEKRAIIPAP